MKQIMKHRFLLPLLMAIVMMAINPTSLWAQNNVITYKADAKLVEVTDYETAGLYIYGFNTIIVNHEFDKSTGIGTITFEDNVTSFEDFSFYECSNLTSIAIPSSVTEIGQSAFQGCSKLTSITIPSSATNIHDDAFKGCSNLTSVTIPSSVTNIGVGAFSNNGNRGVITISCADEKAFVDYLTRERNVFYDEYTRDREHKITIAGQEISSVVIPDGVTSIVENAFMSCHGITSVTIPSSVTNIGENAFYNITEDDLCFTISCADEKAFVDYLTRENNVFYDEYQKDKEHKITITGQEISSVVIPDGVTSIVENAFRSCHHITSVTIPSNVTNIGEGAFSGCSNLMSVTFEATTPASLGDDVFFDSPLQNIYVPASSLATYKEQWSDVADLFIAPVSVTTSSTTTYYDTLADAWDAATAQTGAVTITLHTNIKTSELNGNNIESESSGPQITLDLNDKVIQGASATNYIIHLNKPNTLTIVDNATDKTRKYFTVDGTTCALSDSETSNSVTGGVITGAQITAIYYESGTLLEVRNVNFIKNGSSDNYGGAIGVKTLANIYGCKFYGNKGFYGGAIYAENKTILKDCEAKYNSAMVGGAIYSNSILTVINTTIKNNVTTYYGGGVYLGNNACLAAGTMITMADGSQKKIDDVVEGDMIRTFDHESGTLTSSPVFLAMKGLAPVHSYTLTFESGNTVEVIGKHAFLCESTRKYETFSNASAASFIGKSFYNADSKQWERLVSVTNNSTPAYYYSLTTANQINYVANGMLNVGADYSFLLNLYELDSNLKADATQLAEDIATYGLDNVANYPMLAGLEPLFEALNAKYLKVAVGKGLVNSEFIANMIGSVDFGNGTNAGNSARRSTKRVAETAQEPTCNTYTSGVGGLCLIVGHDVVLTDNTYSNSANNLFVDEKEESSNGTTTKHTTVRLIPDNHANSSIGVSVSANASMPRTITEGTVAESDLSIFTSDASNDTYDIFFAKNQIVMCNHAFTEKKSYFNSTEITNVYACDRSCGKAVTDGTPVYSRTMANKWGTIVLPFDVTISSETDPTVNGYQPYDFYSVSSVAEGILSIEKITGTLSAGTPALIRMSEAAKDAETGKYNLSVTAPSNSVSTTINNPDAVDGLTLTGSYETTDITDKNGYIIANNAFWSIKDIKGENKVYNAPFRAYIACDAPNAAKMLTIGINDNDNNDDDATGINQVTTSSPLGELEGALIYNLNGQRLNAPQKGINIINGKKVLVK